MHDFQEMPAYCLTHNSGFEDCFLHTEDFENFSTNCTSLRVVKLLSKYLGGNMVFY